MGAGGGDYALHELSDAALATKVDLLRAAAADRFEKIELNSLTQVLVVTDDRTAVLHQLSEEWEQDPDSWQESPFLLIGSVDSIAEDIRRYRETLGFTYFVLRDFMMDDFAPILAKLEGT